MKALKLVFLGCSFWSSQLQQRIGDGYKDTRLSGCGDYGTMDLCDLTFPRQHKQSPMNEQMFRTAAGGGEGRTWWTHSLSLLPSPSSLNPFLHWLIDWLIDMFSGPTKEMGEVEGRDSEQWAGAKESGFSGNCAKTTWGKLSCEMEMCAQGRQMLFLKKLSHHPLCCLIPMTPAFISRRVQWTQLEHCFFSEQLHL